MFPRLPSSNLARPKNVKSSLAALIVLLFLAQACGQVTPISTPAAAPSAITVRVAESPVAEPAVGLEALGGEPCPDSEFTCVTLTVPLNHFDPQDERTLEVVFAILPAAGERKGMFVTAAGGPGSAGLASAEDYTAAFDPSIPEHFDIVFFDQRGAGFSGGLQCANAAAEFYRANWTANTPEEEAALIEAARRFSAGCVAEMNDPAMLPFLGTRQAVEDLEAFRRAMGEEKFWLYGESYGTQYAQTYAAVHPHRLAGLILDGAVDLTLPAFDFYMEQARAFSKVLEMTFAACNQDEFCAESMGGGDAAAVYDKLAARLKQSPLAFDFPLPSGRQARREFTFADLETAAADAMYSEEQRMLFLRALAVYSQTQNLIPLARLLYSALALDPETLQPIPDPSYSDAVYYGVECQDYSYESAEAYLRAGDKADALPYLSSVFYGDLPCAFWKYANKDSARPAPLTAEGIPTLVLAAKADPATPYSNGVSVFERLSDGYFIAQEGGPHIIFGRGVPCIDDLVTAFLVNGQTPPARETVCEGDVIGKFAPPAPASAKQFSSLPDAFQSLEDEIYYLPEYYYWDGSAPAAVGCPFGGTLSFEASDAGDILTLENCSFSEGFILTGRGANNYNEGSFTLKVDVSGWTAGSLIYVRGGEGALRLSGVYGGETIELTR